MKYIRLFFIYAACVGLLCWVIGFIAFCYYAVSLRYQPDVPVQGIVVLTGGSDRIDTGLKQLREKQTDALLISGVNKVVSREDIMKRVLPGEEEKITLGYWAENTLQNAIEAAHWANQNRYDTILLVTSFYHMPRAMFEVSHMKRDLKIVPYPVFPRQFDESVDWVKTKYAWFLFLEYNKYIIVHILDGIRRIF